MSPVIITITAVTTTLASPVEPACTNGKVFETCGTACPLTCDNYLNPPSGCIAECVEGCFCPQGLVQLGDTCVSPTSCPGEFAKLLFMMRVPYQFIEQLVLLLLRF